MSVLQTLLRRTGRRATSSPLFRIGAARQSGLHRRRVVPESHAQNIWLSCSSDQRLDLSSLTAVSPIDGRYANQTAALRNYFSEYALIEQRVVVEVAWLKFLASREDVPEVPPLGPEALGVLDQIVSGFDLEGATRVKEFEATTNHDVKAVEYFVKEKISLSGNSELKAIEEFVHFSCTSEDINNLAYGLLVRRSRTDVLLPAMDDMIACLKESAVENADVPMLARTHGQAATPTTVGKELANFVHRLKYQRDAFETVPVRGKFNGAVGNFNAHMVAYPDIDWAKLSRSFVEESLGLTWNAYTTQIEPHDYISEIFDSVCRFNTILLDFNRDMWSYISIGYFKQRAVAGETGSSTMPHKVNPINFENSEGNIGLANAVMQHFVTKLPVSRYQRDLSDSTVLRSIGVGYAHSLIAYKAVLRGMSRIDVNHTSIADDLNENWEVLAEPIQTVMRKYNVPGAYEKLKQLTRGHRIDADSLRAFVDSLRADGVVPAHELDRLQELTPHSYVGNAAKMAQDV